MVSSPVATSSSAGEHKGKGDTRSLVSKGHRPSLLLIPFHLHRFLLPYLVSISGGFPAMSLFASPPYRRTLRESLGQASRLSLTARSSGTDSPPTRSLLMFLLRPAGHSVSSACASFLARVASFPKPASPVRRKIAQPLGSWAPIS